ncbi:hypothetical protein [uncultured Methylophaga sp.]|uniref:hypothetical protein n=1 Tax=uncultured Methylophaga sp. TaxID=285271 RepID=UPI002635EF72|nr:hypothetical protein [uncultured Methylophaga sp.]
MNKNLAEKIFEQCPIIYRSRHDKSTIVGSWGFECNEGWGEIIYNLSLELETLAKKEVESGVPLSSVIEVRQVKQKFAQLRFYVSSTNDAVFDLISHYEQIALKTCEFCSELGSKIEINGYYCVACPKCKKSQSSRDY